MKKVMCALLSVLLFGCGGGSLESSSNSSKPEQSPPTPPTPPTTDFEKKLVNDYDIELNTIQSLCNSTGVTCLINENEDAVISFIYTQSVTCNSEKGAINLHTNSQQWNITKSTFNTDSTMNFGSCAGSPNDYQSYSLNNSDNSDIVEIDAEEGSYLSLGVKFDFSYIYVTQQDLINSLQIDSNYENIEISKMNFLADVVTINFITSPSIAADVGGSVYFPKKELMEEIIRKTWGF